MDVSQTKRPYRNASGAPRFSAEEDRDALELFLDDFGRFVEPYNLSPQDMIHECVLYTDKESRRLWRCLDAYKDGSEWQEFTKAVLELYPSTELSDYSMENFQRLVRSFQEPEMVSGSSTERIGTLKGFVEYHRQALPFTEVWISQGIYTAKVASRWYFSVFEGDLRTKIDESMSVFEPDIFPAEQYPISSIRKAAVAILQRKLSRAFPLS